MKERTEDALRDTRETATDAGWETCTMNRREHRALASINRKVDKLDRENARREAAGEK